jgi:RNA polymerase sigma factor (sigma-70 family)
MTARCHECRPDLIAELVRAGDMAALDRISRCYGAHLLAVGRRVCRDHERARDAVQDALLAAGERLDQYRGEGSVEGWLVAMVANACRSGQRGRKDQAEWNRPLDEESPTCAGDRPDDGAARSELAEALEAALADLPPRGRPPHPGGRLARRRGRARARPVGRERARSPVARPAPPPRPPRVRARRLEHLSFG